MPCSSLDNTFNPSPIPATPLPGFGIPFSPINPEYPGIKLPDVGAIQSVLELVNNLQFIVSSGVFHLNPNESSRTIMDAIANIFSQVAPFLSLYNFFGALLKIIICVIEVLCAIPNPFKLVKAIKKLFSQCLPPFLAMFPPLALPVMILSFLLLLLALIEYIIVTFLKILEDIIQNITNLSEAIRDKNQDAIDAIEKKISFLICQIENLFAIISAIAAILEIIKSLVKLASGTICDDQNADGCCGEDTCPQFISQNPNGISGNLGQLIYQKQRDPNLGIFSALPGFNANDFNFQPLRSERWQFLDTNVNQIYSFLDMITPIQGNIFFPEGVTFDKTTNANKAPYTLDLMFEFNPNSLHPSDVEGFRKFYIKDCIITKKPTNQIIKFDNTANPNIFGTVFIEGGLVFESDKVTPYILNGSQASLNDFIHQNSSAGIPVSDDSLIFNNVEFLWNINHEVLMGYSIITLGCIPEVAQEKQIQNALITAQTALTTIPLPDLNASQLCLQNALLKFKQNISIDNAAIFQSDVLSCLNKLKQDSLNGYLESLLSAVNIYNSEITLIPTIQFIKRNILVSIILKNASGINIAINIPADLQIQISSYLKAFPSFGLITDFSYNNTTFAFDANLSSDIVGKGKLTIDFNNQTLSKIITGNQNNLTKVEEQIIDYEFINMNIESEKSRYNEMDVAIS